MPASWWNMLKAGATHYWAIVGVNTATQEWQVAGPWTFKKKQ